MAPPPKSSADPRQAERQDRLSRHPYMMRSHHLPGLMARAKAAIARGEFEQAYNDLLQATRLDSGNREAAMLLAEARRRHETQRAQGELERGLQLESQGERAAALVAYRRACTLDSQNAEAAFRAASLGRTLGMELIEVRTLLMRAVELEPTRVPAHLLLAQVYLRMGSRKLADKHFEEVLRLEPGNAEARAHVKKAGWSLRELFRKSAP